MFFNRFRLKGINLILFFMDQALFHALDCFALLDLSACKGYRKCRQNREGCGCQPGAVRFGKI